MTPTHFIEIRKTGIPFLAAALLAFAIWTPKHVLAAPAQLDPDHATWRAYAGNSDSSSYSSLAQVNKTNLSQLHRVWTYPTDDDQLYQMNPIVVDRAMYVFGQRGSIVALDAVTGRRLWRHPAPEGGTPTRGFSYWQSQDGKDRRLFMTWNNALFAIDAITGRTISSFGKNGQVDLREGLGRDPATISSILSKTPGRIFENLIILGSAPGEDYMSAPGDIRAYDVRTGALVWTFHTVPHPGEYGYNTWPKDAWRYSGGANAWGDFTVDQKRGIVFLPTGSATYDFYGADRPGDNLFADCLLALDARTGKRIWHAQTVHHDLGDYDNAAAPILLNAKIDGKQRRIVALAGKTGFLYVYDELTGKPVWPIVERPVPRSHVPGEQDSPTQPFPTKPPPFARQRFTVNDINPLLPPTERAKWAEFIAHARNDGLFSPPELDRPTVNMPGHSGGAALFASSSDPWTGEMYVVSFDGPSFLQLKSSPEQTLDNNWHGPAVSAWYGCESVCEEKAPPGQVTENGAPIPAASPQIRDAGHKVYTRTCQGCHGEMLQGGAGPSLQTVTQRIDDATIRSILKQGQGQMPPFPTLEEDAITNLIAFLHDPGVKKDRNYNSSENKPYPPGAYIPGGGKRYFSGWGFAPALIGPPWSTLTAYDLNSGTIKWQVPYGEAMGVAPKGNNYGILQFHGPKASVAVTASGLLLAATPDSKFRAWDKDTGRVLWSDDLPDRAGGIPAIYEIGGKEYITISVRGRYITYALSDGRTQPSTGKQ